MRNQRNKKGFSLAEMLVVVAIIAILGGVIFINVIQYQRTLAQFERDNVAQEIFIAAQNHLTMAESQGYLGMTTANFGIPDTSDPDKKNIYYFVVNKGDLLQDDNNDLIDVMLPFASVDETVRLGGSYIICYQTNPALVLDVFYCSTGDGRFDHSLAGGDYSAVVAAKGTAMEQIQLRRAFTEDKYVLGWYGGEGLQMAAAQAAPAFKIINAERLTVEVTAPNDNSFKVMLCVKGNSNGALKTFELKTTSTDDRVKDAGLVGTQRKYIVTLDDITTPGMHFAELSSDPGPNSKPFIPGDDITVWTEITSTSVTLPGGGASSRGDYTNSLFAKGTDETTALIQNFRHLENLDQSISGLSYAGTDIKITKAEQDPEQDLWWNDNDHDTPDFVHAIGGTVQIYKNGEMTAGTSDDCYLPVTPSYPLEYNGNGKSISFVKVHCTGDAGLFGTLNVNESKVRDLALIDFNITGTTSAGALVGSADNCTVTNVLARNSEDVSSINITALTAGGLIGKTGTNTTVKYSAAAVIVEGTTEAGGLIGNASGTITGCYSGGHTKNGSYEEWINTAGNSFDVTGATAGGLVGTSSATINYSYSTCSVSGTLKEGGFVGSASGSIANCYATGYIDSDEKIVTKYAFVADGNPTLSGNYYCSVINEVPKTGTNAKQSEIELMQPVSGYDLEKEEQLAKVKPIDLNTDTYNTFVGAWNSWNDAIAYDSKLVKYYSGKYTLQTVDELGAALPDGYTTWDDLFVSTHYGDWPAPEIFIINESVV